MIRVLQFADIINEHDFIHSIVAHADPREFQMSVAVRSEASNIAMPVYPEGTAKFLVSGGGRLGIPMAAWELAQILRKEKIDILHTHHYDQALIGALATRWHPPTRFLFGRHYCHNLYRIPSFFKRSAFVQTEKWVNGRATRVIVPSQAIRDILLHQGTASAKIDVIPYGFVPGKYAPVFQETNVPALRQACDSEGRFVFATFARLHEEKGHLSILAALKGVVRERPDAVLWIVGDGPQRKRLEHEVQRLELQKAVRMLGWRRDAMQLMMASDVVLHASVVDAFCQVMGEAMWLRKPLIITRVAGAIDHIQEGKNGIIVPLMDSCALEKAMLRVAQDGDLRARIAAGGEAYVHHNLSLQAAISRYQDSYRKSLEN